MFFSEKKSFRGVNNSFAARVKQETAPIMNVLSRSEELILLAIWRLQDEAYGITIRNLLIEITNRSWSIGAVYVPLDKLIKRQFVRSRQAPPTGERGGRGKRMFRLTPGGVAALNEVRTIHDAMWKNLPVLAPRLI